jgi:hypothetical protein
MKSTKVKIELRALHVYLPRFYVSVACHLVEQVLLL